ncbi:MAG: hypothetical protein K1Y36_24200 [Blastocatellia bacterium]|nr:hypothetical protein [Blastocatellia bacterium]
MDLRISDLWRWDGKVGRGPYIIIGLVLFALKHNLDRFTASLIFHRPWSLFNYLIPSEAVLNVNQLPRADLAFYGTLIVTALPFIYVGVVLTLRRLRAIHLPVWLVVLFFVPLINLLFFIILAVLPSRDVEQPLHSRQKGRFESYFGRMIPDNAPGSAAMSLLIVVPLTAAQAWGSVSVLKQYGWGLFVGLPFMLGLAAVVIYGYHRQRSFGSCLLVALLSIGLLGVALVALAVEGVFCIAMAAPIGFVLGLFGGAIGYLIQLRPYQQYGDAPRILLVLIFSLPVLMGAESRHPSEPPLIPVRTAVEINAPPETVWKHVVSFSELPPPDGMLFKIGVAFPLRAEIKGQGVGAVRHCVFSTGPFVEPIEVWDEPRLLKFSVTSQPPAMKEWTPYSDIHPPHIDNYLVSEGGQFLLTALPNGRTRLEGTTWYRHQIWPVAYWQVWSDLIIHKIHLRVLDHVKNLSEQDVKRS